MKWTKTYKQRPYWPLTAHKKYYSNVFVVIHSASSKIDVEIKHRPRATVILWVNGISYFSGFCQVHFQINKLQQSGVRGFISLVSQVKHVCDKSEELWFSYRKRKAAQNEKIAIWSLRCCIRLCLGVGLFAVALKLSLILSSWSSMRLKARN